MSRFVCVVCLGDPDVMADCKACAGSGLVRNVPFASRRWDQLAPNLWIGGHDWSPDGSWDGHSIEADEVAEAGFDFIVSFYKRWGATPPGVEEVYQRIPDGDLDEEDLRSVRALAVRAAEQSRAGRKTLIRCQAGLNRASLCSAYALVHLGFTPQAAIEHIRRTRSPYCLCNGSFVNYLLKEEL